MPTLQDYYRQQAISQGRVPRSIAQGAYGFETLTPEELMQIQANKATIRGSKFSVPMGLFPHSGSSSKQGSKTAIDWSTPLGQTLLPMIQAGAKNLPGLAENLGQTLQNQYQTLMRESLQPQAFQGILNQLASKGVLDSSVASNALSRTASDIAQRIGQQGYLSALKGIETKMNVPGMLGNLAELARVSEAQSVSRSEQANPLAPYELMARMLMY